jgi:hypothetical protein
MFNGQIKPTGVDDMTIRTKAALIEVIKAHPGCRIIFSAGSLRRGFYTLYGDLGISIPVSGTAVLALRRAGMLRSAPGGNTLLTEYRPVMRLIAAASEEA